MTINVFSGILNNLGKNIENVNHEIASLGDIYGYSSDDVGQQPLTGPGSQITGSGPLQFDLRNGEQNGQNGEFKYFNNYFTSLKFYFILSLLFFYI